MNITMLLSRNTETHQETVKINQKRIMHFHKNHTWIGVYRCNTILGSVGGQGRSRAVKGEKKLPQHRRGIRALKKIFKKREKEWRRGFQDATVGQHSIIKKIKSFFL
jgi:hypothetical protein